MEEIRGNVKEFLDAADGFIKEMRWPYVAVLKICLLSLGMVLAICLPKKWKRPVFFAALFTFIITFLPLAAKWGAYLGTVCSSMKTATKE